MDQSGRDNAAAIESSPLARAGRKLNCSRYGKLVGLLTLAGLFLLLDVGKLVEAVLRVDIVPLVFALLLQVVVLLIKSWRWTLMLRHVGVAVGFSRAARLYVASGGLGVVTPGRAGELVKSFQLKAIQNVPIAVSLPCTILDRVLDFVVYFGMGAAAAIWLGFFADSGMLPVLLTLAVLASAAAIWRQRVKALIRWVLERRLSRWAAKLVDFESESFARSFRQLLGQALLGWSTMTLVAALILFLQFALLLQAARIDVHWLYAIAIPCLLKFISNTPVSIAGIGTRDIALVLILKELGYAPEIAISLSLLLLAVNHLWVGLLGAGCSVWVPNAGA